MKSRFGNSGKVCRGKPKTTSRFAQSPVLVARLITSAFAGALFFVVSATAESLSPGENIATAAEQLLREIRETHYQHKTYVFESAGIYDMDCSGFLDFLLKRVAPEQYARLPIEYGHARPRAARYFEFFAGLPRNNAPGWKSIERLADAQRGDIIAWELETPAPQPGDTGHVIIVAAPPLLARTGEYRVAVYDSSGIRHDDDSRPKETSGIGTGVITFRVDGRGVPVAFQFNSHAHFHLEPIAIGRIIP